jgi:hypothetical protein
MKASLLKEAVNKARAVHMAMCSRVVEPLSFDTHKSRLCNNGAGAKIQYT